MIYNFKLSRLPQLLELRTIIERKGKVKMSTVSIAQKPFVKSRLLSLRSLTYCVQQLGPIILFVFIKTRLINAHEKMEFKNSTRSPSDEF
jgi:hypothetical protein